jgi:hypothetical protein
MRRTVVVLITVTVALAALLSVVRSAPKTESDSVQVFFPLILSARAAPDSCPLGLTLIDETAPLIIKYRQLAGDVSAFTYLPAETYFSQLDSWQRMIVQPSLAGLQTKAERAAARMVPYEALVYAPDRRASTPEEEWQNLLQATQEARNIADTYGKQLVLSPGILLMAENTELYPAMAALADGWIIDAGPFQNANSPGNDYRWDVETVVNRVSAGNSDIAITVLIYLDPAAPNPTTWITYWLSLQGLVDTGHIMVNLAAAEESATLLTAVETITIRVCVPAGG